MDKPKITPRDFFLWAGAMVAFYWSVIAYIFLVFNYIDFVFPNVLTYYPIDPYQSGISHEMASIIVLFPLYLLLMYFIRGDITRDPSRKGVWVRRWAILFTLFVAGIAVAGDLIALLTTFLNGEELSTAFLLKALTIFLITAGVFMHFTADLKDYWDQFPMRRRSVGIGVSVLALITIIAGFFIVGTPHEARQARLDVERVSDLQTIQSELTSYYQAKQALPSSLDALTSSLTYETMPVDPETGSSYGYEKTAALSFKLCATFNGPSRNNYAQSVPIPAGVKGRGADTWQHEEGNDCFDRTIDPRFYPPLK
jgi:hypothetical protein